MARRKGVDHPALPEITRLPIAVELRVLEVGVEFGEDLRDEDRVVGDVTRPLIRDRNSGGITSHDHGPPDGPPGSVDDGHRALCMVRHIEQGAVRGQGAAPRLGAHLDLLDFPALHEVNDRDRAGDSIGDIGYPVGRVDRHTARLLADPNLVQLCVDVIAVVVFHLNN
jgi:hypothetical protein